MKPRLLFVCFLVAAVTGPLLVRLYVAAGVVRFAHPVVWGLTWWVPIATGLASVAMVGAHGRARQTFDERETASVRDVGMSLAWFLACVFVSAAAKDNPRALALLFVASFVARALQTPSSRAMWIHSVVVVVVGMLTLALVARRGAPLFLHSPAGAVPFWAAGVLAHASLLARAVERHWMV